MPLIIETGAGVANANAYADAATVIAYAASRGKVIAADKAEEYIINGMDYLSMFDDKWSGRRSYPNQALAFPRYGVYLDKEPVPYNVLPANLIAALGQLAIAQLQGVILMPTSDGREAFITKEKVDVIETTYSEAVRLAHMAAGGLMPQLPLVAALLAPLMGGGGLNIKTVRV
jgi:hypothetical protein